MRGSRKTSCSGLVNKKNFKGLKELLFVAASPQVNIKTFGLEPMTLTKKATLCGNRANRD